MFSSFSSGVFLRLWYFSSVSSIMMNNTVLNIVKFFPHSILEFTLLKTNFQQKPVIASSSFNSWDGVGKGKGDLNSYDRTFDEPRSFKGSKDDRKKKRKKRTRFVLIVNQKLFWVEHKSSGSPNEETRFVGGQSSPVVGIIIFAPHFKCFWMDKIDASLMKVGPNIVVGFVDNRFDPNSSPLTV